MPCGPVKTLLTYRVERLIMTLIGKQLTANDER